MLFEQINLSSILAMGLMCLNKITLKKKKDFTSKAILLTLSIMFIMNTIFLNIDRSRSFYVISWIRTYQVVDSKELDLTEIKSTEAKNVIAVEQRIKEGISRGVIKESNDKFELTLVGEILYRFSDSTAKLFKLNGWFENKL
jgi:hypothetical protein